jgi:DNA-binding response OmpR family regulator
MPSNTPAAELDDRIGDAMRDGTRPTPDAATILVVEPDPLVREIVCSGLALQGRSWRPIPAADPAEALDRTDALAPDLVIVELALPGYARGAELVRELRRRPRRLPILLVTDAPEEAWRRGVDVDGVLVKPLDIDQLAARVERLLDLHRGSIVRGIALATLLQVLEVERKTVTLRVEGPTTGRLWIRDGVLVRAECADVRGREAFFAMLDWALPVVEVTERCDTPATMQESLQALLLEHAVEKDHGSLPRG